MAEHPSQPDARGGRGPAAEPEAVRQLEERLARRERELEAVHRITAALHARTDVDALVQQTLLVAIEVAEASAGSVLLPDEERARLVFRYVVTESAEVTDRLACREMPADQGMVGRVFQEGRGRITLNVAAETAHYRLIDAETHFRTRDMITVPLRTSGAQTVGVMQVLNRRRGQFSGEDLAVLDILAAQAASAIETAALHAELLETEVARKRFYREVIRCVTGDRLQLVDPEEIPVPGPPALEFSLAEPDAYAGMRRGLLELAAQAGMPRERAQDLELAAGEAATNAIKHGRKGRCVLWAAPDRLIARIEDEGPGIRPEDLPATLFQPGFSTKVSLGMGYTLMLEMVDRIWLSTSPRGTIVQLEKCLQPEEVSDDLVAALLDRF
jgi:anti-sigma regulatory factor (Ser/Thr protein kinase)